MAKNNFIPTKIYKCQMLKLREFFLKKISWFQMIQKCLIRREMEKNGFRRERRFQPPKPKIRLCYHKTQLLSLITYPLTIKINLDITVYANVSVYMTENLFYNKLNIRNMVENLY